jgi:hypothetical protein
MTRHTMMQPPLVRSLWAALWGYHTLRNVRTLRWVACERLTAMVSIVGTHHATWHGRYARSSRSRELELGKPPPILVECPGHMAVFLPAPENGARVPLAATAELHTTRRRHGTADVAVRVSAVEGSHPSGEVALWVKCDDLKNELPAVGVHHPMPN